MEIPFRYNEKFLISEYGYIYITVNTLINKAYIGVRTKLPCRDTHYLGSSTYLKKDVLKYGKQHFKKYILTEGEYNLNFLRELEKHYIRLYNADKSKNFYNISGGADLDLKEAQLKSREAHLKETFKFDATGKLIKKYKSFTECVEDSKGSERGIYYQLNHKLWSRKDSCYFSFDLAFSIPEKEMNYIIYDTDYKEIHRACNQSECATFLKVSRVAISKSVRGNQWVSRKFLVKSIHDKPTGQPYNCRPVRLTNYKEVFEFSSITKAAKFLIEKYQFTGNVASEIIRSIKQSKPIKGYVIEYIYEKANSSRKV